MSLKKSIDGLDSLRYLLRKATPTWSHTKTYMSYMAALMATLLGLTERDVPGAEGPQSSTRRGRGPGIL